MSSTAVCAGSVLREARLSAGMSLAQMAACSHYSKAYLGHVETGIRQVKPDIVRAYEEVLGPVGEDMWRRDITHPRLTKIRGVARLAALSTEIESGVSGVISEAPTAHSTDVALASRLTPDGVRQLRQWAVHGSTATLRTNSLSMLAKMSGEENATVVVDVLQQDEVVRDLCVSSEISRLLQLDWATSRRLANDLTAVPRPRKLASKLAKEVTDPNDTESRWCGAYMLGKLVPVLGR